MTSFKIRGSFHCNFASVIPALSWACSDLFVRDVTKRKTALRSSPPDVRLSEQKANNCAQVGVEPKAWLLRGLGRTAAQSRDGRPMWRTDWGLTDWWYSTQ